MMIEHPEGAIEMAEVEPEDGRYTAPIDPAGDIVKSQSAQIRTMKGLLDQCLQGTAGASS
jgi:uncharacterized protein (DUF305 family)